ncbi:MAG: hypothetical protein NT165_01060 [Candidatus Falkowbacteria bacterium]|nr:hypothetical protein [Candidatus Falkowbacteria bacterium]
MNSDQNAQIEQMLENEQMMELILCLLDVKVLYQIINVEELVPPSYEKRRGRQSLGCLPLPLQKAYTLLMEKSKERLSLESAANQDGLSTMECERALCLKNETRLLERLLESIIRGRFELSSSDQYKITNNWEVVVKVSSLIETVE